ncbi:hypothetical protein [Litorisediminicola beolgyonensis]|uniref:AAA+ family ATPase n=1 Tax=Litorisediminicola beolgyonensis TaxID=1173614 RepID=A0ABW3ZFQ5_9RHOB
MTAKAAILALALALPASVAPAQEEEREGRSLMEWGAELFFRGMMQEMEPALRDLQDLAEEMEPALRELIDEIGPALLDFVEEMGPALEDLMAEVQDWSYYHPPEILPNGDIIIRRREDAPPLEEAEPDGEIEL